jgi:hypothetical protein
MLWKRKSKHTSDSKARAASSFLAPSRRVSTGSGTNRSHAYCHTSVQLVGFYQTQNSCRTMPAVMVLLANERIVGLETAMV